MNLIEYLDNPLLPVAISALSLSLAMVNSCITLKNRSIIIAQEKRRIPNIDIQLIDCYKVLEGTKIRNYYLDILARNTTDIGNAISDARLNIEYILDDKVVFTRTFKYSTESDSHKSANIMNIPCHIAPHDTISGRVFFRVLDSVIKESQILSYSVEFSDTHQNISIVRPNIILER